jgi:hypothetical protein
MVGSRIISMMTKVHMGQAEKAIGLGRGTNSIWWKIETEKNEFKAALLKDLKKSRISDLKQFSDMTNIFKCSWSSSPRCC